MYQVDLISSSQNLTFHFEMCSLIYFRSCSVSSVRQDRHEPDLAERRRAFGFEGRRLLLRPQVRGRRPNAGRADRQEGSVSQRGAERLRWRDGLLRQSRLAQILARHGAQRRRRSVWSPS